MALRTIRIQGDPVLEKVCKPVPEVTEKIRDLIPIAESLNSGMKKHILSILEEALSQAAN